MRSASPQELRWLDCAHAMLLGKVNLLLCMSQTDAGCVQWFIYEAIRSPLTLRRGWSAMLTFDPILVVVLHALA
jgi:hypothetical protein